MDENTRLPNEEATVSVCDIHFRPGSKTYYFDPNGLALKDGDHVIIETARGPEYGFCSGGAHRVPGSSVVQPLRKVLRLATDQDEYVNRENKKLEKTAFSVCQEKIEQLGLDMQLVTAECAFDGSKILFFFTAENRVDFRELVKQLAATFRTRIELRQIGVRDKAKMVGGLGICGRPFCCGQFLNDFAPVSIKMAKTQNLSLNPTKISGTCGRLMCCLKYEQDAYEELLKTCPKAESFVDTPDGRGTVTDVNLMRQSVKVRMEDDPEEIRTYRNEEIAVLRSGKAKKTDLPIPKEVAPISGGKPKPVEVYPRLEKSPVRAEEPAPEEPKRPSRREEKRETTEEPAKKQKKPQPAKPELPEQPAPAASKPNRRRKHRGDKPKPAAPEKKLEPEKKHEHVKAKKAEQPQKKPEKKPEPASKPEQPQETGDAAKKNKKRRYYHHNKKK